MLPEQVDAFVDNRPPEKEQPVGRGEGLGYRTDVAALIFEAEINDRKISDRTNNIFDFIDIYNHYIDNDLKK